MFTVADMMTPHPHTLTSAHTLADAKRLMEEKGIHHVPRYRQRQPPDWPGQSARYFVCPRNPALSRSTNRALFPLSIFLLSNACTRA